VATPATAGRGTAQDGASRPQLVDCDVHSEAPPTMFLPYLETRWREYVQSYGLRTRQEQDTFPGLRTPSRREDSHPPGGGVPGSDPEFARDQLLDAYGVDAAILMCAPGQGTHIGINQPAALSAAMARATNDWTMDAWLSSDERWRSGIHCRVEEPQIAVREIERCVELSDRFVQIAVSPRTERPMGHMRYWELFEIATHYDLPLAFHPGGLGGHAHQPTGVPSSFFELHMGLHFGALSLISSLVFEGVLDRFPSLKIVIVESGWAWAAPLAWRLDASWRVLRDEVPHLERKPSEYVADHLWFTTQPMESPENPKWFGDVYGQFVRAGLDGRLLFSSDYPHWDFDSPVSAIPRDLPESTRQAIFAGNAIGLYGLDRLT
jgi:predicted TIM-barrel fold metal-dependent hydrolase